MQLGNFFFFFGIFTPLGAGYPGTPGTHTSHLAPTPLLTSKRILDYCAWRKQDSLVYIDPLAYRQKFSPPGRPDLFSMYAG